jgi:hypothetical protein
MTVNKLNNAPILTQLEGQYEKFLLLVLRKYKPNGVVITHADIEALLRENEGPDPIVLFSHGHKDSIEFKAIRTSQAAVIQAHHERTMQGRA